MYLHKEKSKLHFLPYLDPTLLKVSFPLSIVSVNSSDSLIDNVTYTSRAYIPVERETQSFMER